MRTVTGTVALTLGLWACSGAVETGPRVAPPRVVPEVVARYEVTVTPGLHLQVEAAFEGKVSGLHVDEEASPFLRDLQVSCAEGCRAKYRFDLPEAARALSDVDVALAAGGAVIAPPGTWLLRPEKPSRGLFELRVKVPSGVRFVTGLHRSKERETGSGGSPPGELYRARAAEIDTATFAGFGSFRTVEAPGTALEVVVAPAVTLGDPAIRAWVERSYFAIFDYFGAPLSQPSVLFVVPGTVPAMRGKARTLEGSAILVRLGTEVTEATLLDDWVLPHELIHLAFPDVGYRHLWFSEGLASYVEPVARVQRGDLSVDRFWLDLAEGLPDGLPGPGDPGLSGTEDRGRIYWGGALYFLLADLRIREVTGGRQSLRDALAAVVATGATGEAYWPIEKVIDLADRATGTRVLRDLHQELVLRPGAPDLDGLLARLGVRAEGRSVRYDDQAPLAALRRTITDVESRSE